MLIFKTSKDGNNLHFSARISERTSKADIRNAVASLLVWISNQIRETVGEHYFYMAQVNLLYSKVGLQA